MKKGILLLLCLASFTAFAQQSTIVWNSNFQEVSTQAKVNNQKILMYFTDKSNIVADQLIQSEVLESESLKSLSNKMVVMGVESSKTFLASGDQGMLNSRLNGHYNKSQSLPALVLVDYYGQILATLDTAVDTDSINEFKSQLQTLIQ